MKDLLNKIDVEELAVIGFCGFGLLFSLRLGNNDVAMAIGGGLVGYLGGVNTKKE